MTLPKLKVGQVWQCLDQGYHALIIAEVPLATGQPVVFQAQLFQTLIQTQTHMACISKLSRYTYEPSTSATPQDVELYKESQHGSYTWPAHLRSLIYDPTDH